MSVIEGAVPASRAGKYKQRDVVRRIVATWWTRQPMSCSPLHRFAYRLYVTGIGAATAARDN
jgi:hypothetical protein